MKAIRRHIETCASGGERRKENANLLLKSKASLVLCISSNYRSTELVVLCSVSARTLVETEYWLYSVSARTLVKTEYCFFLVFDNRGQKR